MGEKKLLDLIKATSEETADFALSNALPEIVKTYGEVFVSEGIAIIAGELIGAVCPRLNNIRLSYKQRRLERNVSIMLERIIDNQETLSNRIDKLQKTVEGRNFIQQCGEMLLDNIVDEIQPSKVQYSVNGYLNLLQTENANLDISLMFFKTISELNDIDIRVLKTYDWREPDIIEPITPFNSELDYDQLKYIREKLLRFGLLKSQNEELSEKNQEFIIDFLKKFHKDLNSKNPHGVRLPNFKKLKHVDTYSITSLGLAFLELISEQCNLTDLSASKEENGKRDEN